MKNKSIKIIALLCSIIIGVFMFTGCGVLGGNQASTAEGAIKSFMELRKSGETDELANLIWTKYFSINGVTKEQYIKIINDSDFKNSVKITDYRVGPVKDFDTNIKQVTVIIKSMGTNQKEQSTDYTYALIKEGSVWKVSPDGVIGSNDYNSGSTVPNDNKLYMYLTKEIKCTQGNELKIQVVNKAPIDFSLGWVDGAKVIVDTDKGQFTAILGPTKITQGLNDYLTVNMPNMSGTIKKVMITSVIELNNGLPANSDTTGTEIIAYQK